MLETALVLPLLLVIVFNTVNFAYLFLVALNLTSSTRSGALYSIQGGETPASISLPQAGPTTTQTSVSYLALNDLNGALANGTSAGVQVCTSAGAPSSWTALQPTPCTQSNFTCPTGATCTPDTDIEAPVFVLNRVDVNYTFHPLIPGFAFNLYTQVLPVCGASGTCTFHRMAEMREMN